MTVVLIKTSSVFSLIGRPQPDNVAASLSSFPNDDGDGNENIKTAMAKQQVWNVHNAFLYTSLPLMHDYDVKMPNFAFYGGRKQATIKFSFSFWTWVRSPRNQLQGYLPTLDFFSELE